MDDSQYGHNEADAPGSTLENGIKQMREQHRARLDQLSTLMASLQSVSESVNADGEVLDALADAARGELDSIAKRVHESASSDRESLQSRIDELSQALEQSERERTSLSEQLEARGAELEELAALREDAEARGAMIAALEARIGEFEARLGAGEDIETLQATVRDAEATHEALRTELKSVQRELDSLRQQLDEAARERDAARVELEGAREQGRRSVLAQQLAEAIAETERLEDENERLKGELGRSGGAEPAPSLQFPELEPAAVAPAPAQVSRSAEDELHRIQESARKPQHGPKRVIGQILLDAGVISGDQLQTALELQKSNPQQHLGSLLAELGFASDEAIAQARASQCGVEYIRFSESTVDPEAAALISRRLAEQHTCIPVSATEDIMRLAVVNPMDLLAIEDVERFSNRKVEVVVGTGPDIEQAIARFYWEPE
ncbi:MAG: hypothetical protein KF886_13400 [Candidatus Hydrogenedentes bacterium]|nr:hypothetical protein [Candidatus Hydrogenedentota bacterium]